MTITYELDQMRENNGGKSPILPHLPIDGYSKGFALMLSDGEHEGICFPGYETKSDAINAAGKNDWPDGWHLYLLKANGRDIRNPSRIRWELRCEFLK